MKEEVRVRVDGETERVLDRIIDAIEPRLRKLEKLDDFENSLSKLEPLNAKTEENSHSLLELRESIEKRQESLLDNLTMQKQALDAVVEGLDGTIRSQAKLVSSLKSELKGMRAHLSLQNESQRSHSDILSGLATLMGEVAEKTSMIEGLGSSTNDKLSSVSTQLQLLLRFQEELAPIRSEISELAPSLEEKLSSIETSFAELNSSGQQIRDSLTQMQDRLDYLSQPWWRRLLKKGKA